MIIYYNKTKEEFLVYFTSRFIDCVILLKHILIIALIIFLQEFLLCIFLLLTSQSEIAVISEQELNMKNKKNKTV